MVRSVSCLSTFAYTSCAPRIVSSSRLPLTASPPGDVKKTPTASMPALRAAAAGDKRVGILLQRVGDEEFQFSHFVPAERKAREVVAFHQDADAQLLRE